MSKKCLFFFLSIVSFFSVDASVVINEIMVKNVSSQIDDKFNFSGWIELYNDGTVSVDASTFYLSKKENDAFMWQIQEDGLILEPKSFAVIYFDELSDGLHASFKLDPDSGSVFLSDASGILLDKVSYPHPYRNVSYGRLKDGDGALSYLSVPTPGKSNNVSSSLSVQTSKPEFSLAGGFYKGSVSVAITSKTQGAKIYYSVDGSEPSVEKSSVYEGELVFNKTTPLRAIAVKDGEAYSEISTATYFIDVKRGSLPVVSLVGDPYLLFGNEYGLLVAGGENGSVVPSGCQGPDRTANYWNDWDRPCNFEFIDTDNNELLNQEVKIGNFGGCSRTKYVRSIKINSSKVFGENNINCPFFPDYKPNIKVKSVVLRNSGNDFGRSYFRDAFMQTLVKDQMDIDYQAYQPSVVYINGNYYGMLNIRERSNKDFVYSNYGLKEEEITFVEGSGRNEHSAEFVELLGLLESDNINSAESVDKINELLDVEEALNYFMSEIYFVNTDWPGGNIKAWRKNYGGKFRYILYDTDFGFSCYGDNSGTNTFSVAEKNPVFKGLMRNDEFRSYLANKFVVHLATTFQPERCKALIDKMSSKIKDEALDYAGYLASKGKIESDWYSSVSAMKKFADERYSKIQGHIRAYFGFSDTCSLMLESNNVDVRFRLGDENIEIEQGKLNDFAGRNIKVSAVVPLGYKFKNWEAHFRKPLISGNEVWNYCDASEVDLATWKQGASSSNWKEGQTVVGYTATSVNKNIIKTEISKDDMGKSITTYFYKKFLVKDLDNLSSVDFELSYNDGAVVYVNGEEIGRVNMPNGEITPETAAKKDLYTKIEKKMFSAPSSVFKAGENIVAVELHQNKLGSTGLFFEMLAFLNEKEPKPEVVNDDVIDFVLSSGIKVKAIVEEDKDYVKPVLPLYLNEICASNSIFADDDYKTGDWIEVYNDSTEDISLAGMYLSDNVDNPRKFKISKDFSTVAPAKGYVVFWADKDTLRGLLHANFELPMARSQRVMLGMDKDGDYVAIDQVDYIPHDRNESYARVSLAADAWEKTEKPTFAQKNVFQRKVDVECITIDDNIISVYPNPFVDVLYLKNAEQADVWYIIKESGEVVLCGEGGEALSAGIDVTGIKKGMYIFVLKINGMLIGKKIIKK